MSALIDSGFLQTNITNSHETLLLLEEATISKALWSLTSDVEGWIFEVNYLVDFDIRFFKPNDVVEMNSIDITDLISPGIQTDQIIGGVFNVLIIKNYNKLNLLLSHFNSFKQFCDVCSDTNTPKMSATQSILIRHYRWSSHTHSFL